jgi:type I restriction enzyme S subunit
MKGWKNYKIGDIADLCLGKMLDDKKNRGEPLPYLANVNVRWGEFDLTDLREMRFESHELDRYGLRHGDIVMCEGGEPGRCAIWKDEMPGMMIQKALHRIRAHDGIDPEFLYYSLLQKGRMNEYSALFTGSTIKHLPKQMLELVEVLVPPLSIQNRITETLSAYDDLIENNRRRIAFLEESARLLYREWFVRLRFPGHATTKITKGLPAGWTLVRTQDAFSFTGGGTPSKEVSRYWQDGTINWFTPTDITAAEGMFLEESRDKCSDEGFAESSAKMFPAYSVMMTSRATIGSVGINLTPACTNQGFITCIPNERYPLPFLYHWIKLGKTHFEMLSVGATFAELTKGTFKKIPVLTPPQAVMDAFAETEAPLFKQIENLMRQNAHLTRTRDLLLPRLISGKLPVEALPIAFPPSMADAR